jgi:hypothetical protein
MNIKPLSIDFLDVDGLITNTDYRQELCLRDETGEVIDLTTWAARMQVRVTPGGALIAEFNSADGSIILSDDDPNIVLVKTRNQTNFTDGYFYYDLRLDNGGSPSKQQLYIRGRIDIIKNITDLIT